MSISSYQIRKDHVAFFNEKGTQVRTVQGKDIKSVNIGPAGNIDIYRGDRREAYSKDLKYKNYYR
jgi:hypothetical protein